MDRLARLRVYYNEYRAKATKLATSRLAREWMEAGVPASEAAQWASHGWTPAEAAPLIAAGVTPDTAAEMDQLANDIAGSPEERAAQRIDDLVRDGVLVDPHRVRTEQDPDDPTHIIAHIDPE